MAHNEIHYLELLEIGRRIQSRETSSKEVTHAMLQRIGKVDPILHSYATLMADQARADADKADDEIAAGTSSSKRFSRRASIRIASASFQDSPASSVSASPSASRPRSSSFCLPT